MIDIQTVACFNTHSAILHLFLPIQCQIHNTRQYLYFFLQFYIRFMEVVRDPIPHLRTRYILTTLTYASLPNLIYLSYHPI